MKILLLIILLFTVSISYSQEIAYGSKYPLNAAAASWISSCALTDTTFVTTYKTSTGVFARIGTVAKSTGNVIAYGVAKSVDTSISSNYVSVGKLTSTSFLLVFNDNAAAGKAVVCTISGTTITVNTLYTFNSVNSPYLNLNILSPTTFVVFYQDTGNSSYPSGRFGTITGTSIAYGTEASNSLANTFFYKTCTLSSSLVIFSYRNSGSGNVGQIGKISISGTNLTIGGGSTFSAGSIISNPGVMAINSTQFIVEYYDAVNSNRLSHRVGTVGVTISYGNTAVASAFTSSDGKNISMFMYDENSYISTLSTSVILSDGTNLLSDISGTSVVLGSSYTYSINTQQTYPSSFLLSPLKFITTFDDAGGNSGYATSIVGVITILGKKINNVLYTKWNGSTITKWNNQ